MGFESLSAMYRPTFAASGKGDRAWLRLEAARSTRRNKPMPEPRMFRFGILRRAVARFVALLF